MWQQPGWPLHGRGEDVGGSCHMAYAGQTIVGPLGTLGMPGHSARGEERRQTAERERTPTELDGPGELRAGGAGRMVFARAKVYTAFFTMMLLWCLSCVV